MTHRKTSESKRVRLDASPPHAVSAEWSEKEHIAETAIVAAQKLLDAAGSPALARQALATVARRGATRSKRRK